MKKLNKNQDHLKILKKLDDNPDFTQRKLSKELGFITCSMEDLGEHLIDGVHFTHEGYNEVANRFSEAILSLA